jgi:hypothetical protein
VAFYEEDGRIFIEKDKGIGRVCLYLNTIDNRLDAFL